MLISTKHSSETTAPEGYTVQKVTKSRVNPREEDLTEGLRAVAEFLGGEFPEVLETYELRQTIRAHDDLNELSSSEEDMKLLFEQVRWAWNYIALLRDFYRIRTVRYLGGGVRLGDAASPVLWWQFNGTEKYRVVYGDLNVQDVSPQNFPISIRGTGGESVGAGRDSISKGTGRDCVGKGAGGDCVGKLAGEDRALRWRGSGSIPPGL